MPKNPGADKRKQVLVFVSYARADRPMAVALLRLFKQHTSASLQHRYRFWRDSRDILIGEGWHDAIKSALKRCDIGLLLISPAFLGSEYITEHELPTFWGRDAKPVVPVLLKPFNARLQGPRALTKMQMFSLLDKHNKPKAFSQCAGNGRDKFALNLFDRVEMLLHHALKPKRRSAGS
jgi:hypothetical protein